MVDGMAALPKCKHGNVWEDCCGSMGHNNGGASSYYELPRDCQTLQDIIVKQEMNFTQGNIFKAAYRWDKKPDLEYNLNKIIWFARDALERFYAEYPGNPRGKPREDQ
jgi:hypothetical protein